MNTIAVERDWVVVVTEGMPTDRQVLNSQMRRIDLFCKLVGPLVISLIDGISTRIAIFVVLGANILSVVAEYYAIAKVYAMVEALQVSRIVPSDSTACEVRSSNSTPARALLWLRSIVKPLSSYLQHPAAPPSIALSSLYLTVLSFGAQMITYLLSFGYTSTQIGLIRTVSVALEMSATWLAPLAMTKIGPLRAGLWFLNSQLLCVATIIGTFWTFDSVAMAVFGLVAGVILSRVGLWGFDLCVQSIIQEEVDAESRGSFSSVEASLQNLFELLSFAATAIFPRPEQFRYPVLMSSLAVLASACLYTDHVRRRRGHLLHPSQCIAGERRKRTQNLSTESVEEGLLSSPSIELERREV
ncbi:MAG: hypothetical protein M1817_003807 [Caeruleum heppii]|nr:MAG: hypothetical protein M1817_003807 [Caeruleum heppii]